MGYRHPPLATRFQSGNQAARKKGRPKGRRSNAVILQEIVDLKVDATLPDGKLKQISVWEAGVRKIALKAVQAALERTRQGLGSLIPSVAFKNANSSYFGSKPFRLILPNLGDLYEHIEAYIDRHRRVLPGESEDPGTFFIKTVKTTSRDASYDQNTFYEAWRLTIQRYGIYNPYTRRGAVPGLLPHGPHNVRDVLATHILKQRSSDRRRPHQVGRPLRKLEGGGLEFPVSIPEQRSRGFGHGAAVDQEMDTLVHVAMS